MTETDKAREWLLAKHKRDVARVLTHNLNQSCVICEQRIDPNWSIKEVAAYGASQYESGKLPARASESSPPQPELQPGEFIVTRGDGVQEVCRYVGQSVTIPSGAAATAPSAPPESECKHCGGLIVFVGEEWQHVSTESCT